MAMPIGKYLVKAGVLTDEQCERILREQARSAAPFGKLAEQLFAIDPADVERAWTDQYADEAEWIDPTLEHADPAVRSLVSRRQAWQFAVLPVRYEQPGLMICTSRSQLVRALRFVTRTVPATCYVVLAEPDQLGEALLRYYPMDGMTVDLLSAPPAAEPAAPLRRVV